MRLTTAFVTALVAALPVSTLRAQAVPSTRSGLEAPARSRTQGLVLGMHLNGSAVAPAGGDVESGGGAGAMIGYGVSPGFMVSAQIDVAVVTVSGDDQYALAHADLGARWSFADPRRAWVPHLDAAITGRAAGQTITDGARSVDVSLSGSAVSVGGGVQYFLTPKLALDGSVLWSFGKWERATVAGQSVDVPDSESFTSSRFNVGLKLYP